MSVKRSVNVVNQLRVDTNDIRSIESSVRNDFDELLKSFVTGQGDKQAYVLRGFEIDTTSMGQASNLQLIVSDSAIFNGLASVGGTFYLVPSGQAPETLNSVSNSKVNGSFALDTANYISIDYTRTPAASTSSPRALWDPVNKTEFSKTLPLSEVLNYKINITQGNFPTGSLPIAIVQTSGSTVVSVTDKRPQLFRLGQSGLNSNNPSYEYGWDRDAEGRTENPSTTTSTTINPFRGGDKQIQNLKEWMDAVMTEIKLIKGSSFWYSNGSSLISNVNLSNVFTDALATIMTGRGKFVHDLATPGRLSWTNNIFLKNAMSNLEVTLSSNTVTLLENQIAYITLERNVIFQPTNIFTFQLGSPTITAATTVTGIIAGDFIKPESESQSKWHRVSSVVGATITLESNYSGSNFSGTAVRTKGVYSSIQISDRASAPSSADMYWLAFRNDNAVTTATISTSIRSSNVATHNTALNHGLTVGQTISITGVTDSSFNGVFTVKTIPTSNSFTVLNEEIDATSTGGQISSMATLYIRDMGEIVQGEEIQINDQTVLNILDYIGSPSESDTSPVYKYTNYLTNGNSLTLGISTLDKALKDEVTILTDWVSDHQEDRSAFLRSNDCIEFASSSPVPDSPADSIIVLQDIVLSIYNTTIGSTTSHIMSAGTYAIANGESLWATIDRTAISETLTIKRTTVNAIPAVSYANKDVFILFTRLDTPDEQYLHVPLHKQVILPHHPTDLGMSGSENYGTIKVDFFDSVSQSLPVGSFVTMDGVAGINGDLVLFTNLLIGNNRVYKLGGVGTSITWKAIKSFDCQYNPVNGDEVRIKKGTAFGNQLAIFNGTEFKINDTVRYFDLNGDNITPAANYWEQSSIKSTALIDNSTGTIFSTAVYGSENLIVDYSIVRNIHMNPTKETGQLFITSDGVNVGISRNNAYLQDPGVSISAAISSGTLQVNYTTTSNGTDALIKYSVKRWSDGLGGPTGIPSYSGSTIGGGNANGADKYIQFNAGGILAGDSHLQWDYTNRNLVLNGLVYDVLSSPITLNDGQLTPIPALTYNAATYRFAVLEYSIVRGTIYRTGRLLITNNGTIVNHSDDFIETSYSGVNFTVSLSGGNVNLNYTTTSTGSSSIFKYSARRWN